MTTLTQRLGLPSFLQSSAKPSFDLSPRMRAVVMIAASVMTTLTVYALGRGLLGYAPDHSAIRHMAIAIHVSAVLPTIPLGGYLLLAPKGTKWHKLLGKLWVALMLITATSAIFIKSGGGYSFIHLFIPITFWASYKLVATARRGDMKGHKKEILSLYLGALMIPGIASMAIPGRLMNVWLFW